MIRTTNIIIALLLSIAFSLMLFAASSHGLSAIFITVCAIVTGSLFFHRLTSYDSMFKPGKRVRK